MDLHQMVGAYALNALDDDEARRFEEHLTDCEACQAELRDFDVTLDALAEPGDDGDLAASPTLHAAVFDEISRTPQVSAPASDADSAPASSAPATHEPGSGPRGRDRSALSSTASLDEARAQAAARRKRRMPARLLAAAAGLVAVAAVGVGFLMSGADERELAVEAERVRSAADAVEYALGLGAATLHVSESEGGVALLGDAPDLPDGETYQVWVVPADGSAPVPGPVLGDGELAQAWLTDLKGAAAIAVSVEPDGGSTTPTEVVTAVEL